jgi:enoyl-CoA hydratase
LNFNRIKIEINNRTGIVCFDNPESLNIIEKDTFGEVEKALDFLTNAENIKIILIKANCGMSKSGKRIFSAGVNLKQYDEKFKLFDENKNEFKELLKKQRNLLQKVKEIEKPVIFAVDGLVCGGLFELSLACDMILASQSASFQLNEVNIGLIPGYGGIAGLLQIVGKNKAFEIIATAKELSAEEACSLNIVSKVFENEIFEEKTMEFCEKMSEKSSKALYLIKNTIKKLIENSISEEIEMENFLHALQANDSREGIKAFLDKRNPVF